MIPPELYHIRNNQTKDLRLPCVKSEKQGNPGNETGVRRTDLCEHLFSLAMTAGNYYFTESAAC